MGIPWYGSDPRKNVMKRLTQKIRYWTYAISPIASALVTTFILAYPPSGEAQSIQQVARRAFEGTVLLVMEDVNGQPLSLGSGFFVLEDQLATNFHVVKGASRGYAKLVGQKSKYDIEGITAIDVARDLVLLKVRSVRVPPLRLGDSSTVEIGETVFAVGNPQGLEGTFSQGIISSLRGAGESRLLQITAPISPGSSGGPVLNAKGEVIGVSVATFKGGQNLNFAIPSIYLKGLIGKSAAPRPLEVTKASNSTGSIVAEFGGPSTGAVVGSQLIWTYPACSNCGGDYSFSLRNQLRSAVRNVTCQVIFFDATGEPLEVDVVEYNGVIPAGLARRVTRSVHQSVKDISKNFSFRILDFQIAE